MVKNVVSQSMGKISFDIYDGSTKTSVVLREDDAYSLAMGILQHFLPEPLKTIARIESDTSDLV